MLLNIHSLANHYNVLRDTEKKNASFVRIKKLLSQCQEIQNILNTSDTIPEKFKCSSFEEEYDYWEDAIIPNTAVINKISNIQEALVCLLGNDLITKMFSYINGMKLDHWVNGDLACRNGHLKLIKSNRNLVFSPNASREASRYGHITVLEWLHENQVGGFSTRAMDAAAESGNLDVVEWLHRNRSEGCSSRAMDGAAGNGWLDVVEWLHLHRKESCTVSAMDNAAAQGHLPMLRWLHSHRSEGCSEVAFSKAARNGCLAGLEWLVANYPCALDKQSKVIVDQAAFCGHLQILLWLQELGCGAAVDRGTLENASFQGHFSVVEWLFENFDFLRTVTQFQEAVVLALERAHFQVIEFLLVHGDKNQHLTEIALRTSACSGYRELLEWLALFHAAQGFSRVPFEVMDCAAAFGHLEIVQLLHAYAQVDTAEGCSTKAMDEAATNGHLQIVEWLHENRAEGCTKSAVRGAAKHGHVKIVQWLLKHRSEGF